MIHQEFRGMPCTYAISSRTRADEVGVTRMIGFDPRGNGAVLWQRLQNAGRFDESAEPRISSKTSECIDFLLAFIYTVFRVAEKQKRAFHRRAARYYTLNERERERYSSTRVHWPVLYDAN